MEVRPHHELKKEHKHGTHTDGQLTSSSKFGDKIRTNHGRIFLPFLNSSSAICVNNGRSDDSKEMT